MMVKQCTGIIVSIALLHLAGCQPDTLTPQPPAGAEGNCIGTVLDTDGKTVTGAVVTLIPEGYDPFHGNGTAAHPESTITDSRGQFGFATGTSGTYNLFFRSNSRFAQRTAVHISADARTTADAVVKQAGALYGTVTIEGKSDSRDAVVLLPGTSRYTQPYSAAGNYAVDLMAEGTYLVRAVSLQSGFTVAETTVTITAGSTTECTPLVLKMKKCPAVENFSVSYDSLRMTATLAWSAADTSLISGYAVYCNREHRLTPAATPGINDTTLRFDLLSDTADTFTFQIAAVGRDGSEGPAVTGDSFVKRSGFKRTGVISYKKFHAYYRPEVSIDPYGDFYIAYEHVTGKIGSNGAVLGEYGGDFFKGLDRYGNAYFSNYSGDTTWLTRTDKTLQPVDSFIYYVNTHPAPHTAEILAVWEGGAEVLYDSVVDAVNNVTEHIITGYDTALLMIRTYHTPEKRYMDYHSQSFSTLHSVTGDFTVYEDSTYRNFVNSGGTGFLDEWIPRGYECYGQYTLGPGGIGAARCVRPYSRENPWDIRVDLVILFTIRGDVLARIPFDSTPSDFFFDTEGNLYQSIWIYEGTTDTIAEYPAAELIR